MNIESIRKILSGIVFASGVLFTPVAGAQKLSQTLEQALQSQISAKMRMPPAIFGRMADGGIARVVFEVGPDGKTHFVKVDKSSGSYEVDREAIRLISSFSSLPPGVKGVPVYAVLQYGKVGQQNDEGFKKDMQLQVASAKGIATSTYLARIQLSLKLAQNDIKPQVVVQSHSSQD